MEKLKEYERASGQKVNLEKCTFLLTEDEDRFEGHPFEEKEEERYLGVNLGWDGRISLLPVTLDRVVEDLTRWKRRHLNLKERTTILKAYIFPRLLYQLPYCSDPPWDC